MRLLPENARRGMNSSTLAVKHQAIAVIFASGYKYRKMRNLSDVMTRKMSQSTSRTSGTVMENSGTAGFEDVEAINRTFAAPPMAITRDHFFAVSCHKRVVRRLMFPSSSEGKYPGQRELRESSFHGKHATQRKGLACSWGDWLALRW